MNIIKNETKIIIIKKDQDDGKVLEGIEFQLLNDKKRSNICRFKKLIQMEK